MNAHDIMTRHVVTVGPGHSIRHAARLMLDNRISGLPVVDDSSQLVGMITEGDMLRREELGGRPADGDTDAERAGAYVRSRSWCVSDVMSRNVISIGEETVIREICALMLTYDIKRLPVLHDTRLVGIVSRSDLLRVVAAGKGETVAAGDDAIACAVRARLHGDLHSAVSNVDVAVRNGLVTLSGTVTDIAMREAARVAAESVPGVAGVTNDLALLIPGVGRPA